MQRVVGVGGLAALLFVAVWAGRQTQSPQVSPGDVASQRPVGRAVRRARPLVIPAAEVIVGHPRDGIVELPDLTRKVAR